MLLVAAVLLDVLCSALCHAVGLTVFRPEMPLLVALYAGLSVANQRAPMSRSSWLETSLIGLLAGYFGDLLAGAPIGLGALACLVIALIARSVADRLLLSTFWRTALVAWFFALGHGAILMLILAATIGLPFYRQLPLILGISVASGLVAPVVFALLNRLLLSGTRTSRATSLEANALR